ncbi:MAG: hypothetical protein H5T43_08600 [Methanomethylovorans sp.]|jgi:KEOPS complex subunit Cgi121|nr:hypothetical protein [Methanomethylovorans sp.]
MHFEFLSGFIYIENLKGFLEKITEISESSGCTIQCLNADLVAGEKHLLFAVTKALRAFDQGKNAAKDMGIEIMRYASGKRQIEEAFSMGVHEGLNNIVFIIIGEMQAVSSCMDILKKMINTHDVISYLPFKREKIMEQFEITAEELAVVGEQMIPALVIERVALVDILK